MNAALSVLPNWVLKYWPLFAVVGWTTVNWHNALPPCCPPNGHDYWELGYQVMAVLGAGAAIPRPNGLSPIMNTLTFQPQEPIIPDSIKSLAPMADAAVAEMGTRELSNVNKKVAAASQVQQEAADSGIIVPDHAANISVELAILKSQTGG